MDARQPLYPDEAFQDGIQFTAKYIGTLDVPRPNSRAEIVAAMRRIRFEFKSRAIKKKKVTLVVNLNGVTVSLSKRKKGNETDDTGGEDEAGEEQLRFQSSLIRAGEEKNNKSEDNKLVLLQNPIFRIFYVSHDSQDLKIFSYICRDGSNSPFRCNVFKSFKKSQAMRIVRTIGQAFEVCHRYNTTKGVAHSNSTSALLGHSMHDAVGGSNSDTHDQTDHDNVNDRSDSYMATVNSGGGHPISGDQTPRAVHAPKVSLPDYPPVSVQVPNGDKYVNQHGHHFHSPSLSTPGSDAPTHQNRERDSLEGFSSPSDSSLQPHRVSSRSDAGSLHQHKPPPPPPPPAPLQKSTSVSISQASSEDPPTPTEGILQILPNFQQPSYATPPLPPSSVHSSPPGAPSPCNNSHQLLQTISSAATTQHALSVMAQSLQLTQEQLSQQQNETQVALSQLHLLKEQLNVESASRIEAQARIQQLLIQNRELVLYVQQLTTQINNLETNRVIPTAVPASDANTHSLILPEYAHRQLWTSAPQYETAAVGMPTQLYSQCSKGSLSLPRAASAIPTNRDTISPLIMQGQQMESNQLSMKHFPFLNDQSSQTRPSLQKTREFEYNELPPTNQESSGGSLAADAATSTTAIDQVGRGTRDSDAGLWIGDLTIKSEAPEVPKCQPQKMRTSQLYDLLTGPDEMLNDTTTNFTSKKVLETEQPKNELLTDSDLLLDIDGGPNLPFKVDIGTHMELIEQMSVACSPFHKAAVPPERRDRSTSIAGCADTLSSSQQSLPSILPSQFNWFIGEQRGAAFPPIGSAFHKSPMVIQNPAGLGFFGANKSGTPTPRQSGFDGRNDKESPLSPLRYANGLPMRSPTDSNKACSSMGSSFDSDTSSCQQSAILNRFGTSRSPISLHSSNDINNNTENNPSNKHEQQQHSLLGSYAESRSANSPRVDGREGTAKKLLLLPDGESALPPNFAKTHRQYMYSDTNGLGEEV